jgi:hypothetical protein
MRGLLKKSLCCGVLLVMLLAAPLRAQTADVTAQEVNALFDGLCLAYLGDGHKMLEEAYAIGAKPIPQFFAQQFLGKHRGVALAIQGQGSLYMLGLTEQPSCLIAAPEANGVAVLQAFAAGKRRLPVTEGVVDGQYQQVYAVVREDAVSGMKKSMVVTATISPQQGTPGIIITALPAKTAAAIGIVPPEWPE